MANTAPSSRYSADVTCLFTHVGLQILTTYLAHVDLSIAVRLRAWPHEWVEGVPFEAPVVAPKVDAVRDQLGADWFVGWRTDRWPKTTIPALNLVAAAYRRSASFGLEISLALRSMLFDDGLDISEHSVLDMIADSQSLPRPGPEPVESVLDDHVEGPPAKRCWLSPLLPRAQDRPPCHRRPGSDERG